MKECDGRENSTGSRKSLPTCFGKESFSRFRKLLIAALNDGFGFNVYHDRGVPLWLLLRVKCSNPVIDSNAIRTV